MKEQTSVKSSPATIIIHMLQGALIGLGSVLPGISGGVLSVVFGVYKPIMELLSNPFRHFKTHVPRLLPYILGAAAGFLGVANLLAFFLEKYPAPSVCLFIGLITGMFPSLWEEAGLHGRTKGSIFSTVAAMFLVFTLLIILKTSSITITPNFFWYLFCGFCFSLSIIAPGMSFSTLLMPLGLYTPFVDGLGHLSPDVVLPSGIGALATIVCLSKLVNSLFENYYSFAFHAILGIVIAATVMIIPFDSFRLSVNSCLTNIFFFSAGMLITLLMDKMNLS